MGLLRDFMLLASVIRLIDCSRTDQRGPEAFWLKGSHFTALSDSHWEVRTASEFTADSPRPPVMACHS
jgi:hypothetical protein